MRDVSIRATFSDSAIPPESSQQYLFFAILNEGAFWYFQPSHYVFFAVVTKFTTSQFEREFSDCIPPASKQFGVFSEVRSFGLILCSSSFQIVPGGGSAAKEGAELEGISGALILGLELLATRKVAAGLNPNGCRRRRFRLGWCIALIPVGDNRKSLQSICSSSSSSYKVNSHLALTPQRMFASNVSSCPQFQKAL